MTRPMPGPPEPEPHEGNTRPHDRTAAPWDYCPGCAAENRLRLAECKRLTDAECAAEYWRASDHLRYALAMDQSRYRVRPERSDDPPSASVNKVWREKNAWHRFTHTPHALEADGAAS